MDLVCRSRRGRNEGEGTALTRHFGEFLNRIDDAVVFTGCANRDEKIVEIQLARLARTLEDAGCVWRTPAARCAGKDTTPYGAFPKARHPEIGRDALARMVLEGRLTGKATIEMDAAPDGQSLLFTPRSAAGPPEPEKAAEPLAVIR
jgi:ATP-dependent Clp protease ATP-binding subunit ClpA